MRPGIGGSELPEKIRSVMSGAGEMILAGRFDGGLRSFDTDLKLTTQAGNASLAVKRTPMKAEEGVRGRRYAVRAAADVRHLRLGTPAARHDVRPGHGVAALRRHNGTTAAASTATSRGPRRLGRGDGLPLRLADPFGTRYRQDFTGTLRSDCDPLRMMLSGKADMNGAEPVCDVRLVVEHADLHAMNINRRDSISTIAMGAEMYAVGRWPDEMNGTLSLGGQYVYPATRCAAAT